MRECKTCILILVVKKTLAFEEKTIYMQQVKHSMLDEKGRDRVGNPVQLLV